MMNTSSVNRIDIHHCHSTETTQKPVGHSEYMYLQNDQKYLLRKEMKTPNYELQGPALCMVQNCGYHANGVRIPRCPSPPLPKYCIQLSPVEVPTDVVYRSPEYYVYPQQGYIRNERYGNVYYKKPLEPCNRVYKGTAYASTAQPLSNGCYERKENSPLTSNRNDLEGRKWLKHEEHQQRQFLPKREQPRSNLANGGHGNGNSHAQDASETTFDEENITDNPSLHDSVRLIALQISRLQNIILSYIKAMDLKFQIVEEKLESIGNKCGLSKSSDPRGEEITSCSLYLKSPRRDKLSSDVKDVATDGDSLYTIEKLSIDIISEPVSSKEFRDNKIEISRIPEKVQKDEIILENLIDLSESPTTLEKEKEEKIVVTPSDHILLQDVIPSVIFGTCVNKCRFPSCSGDDGDDFETVEEKVKPSGQHNDHSGDSIHMVNRRKRRLLPADKIAGKEPRLGDQSEMADKEPVNEVHTEDSMTDIENIEDIIEMECVEEESLASP